MHWLRWSEATASLVVGLVLLLVGVGMAAPARAINYIGEWVNDFGNCSSGCSNGSYNAYNDDMIGGFSSKMNEKGYYYGSVVYSETSVWASDVVEDGDGGSDWIYGDAKTVLAIASHGSAYTDETGAERHRINMCMNGNMTDCHPTTGIVGDFLRLGEQCGTWATHGGAVRWALMGTCHSVENNPWQQWVDVTGSGLAFIAGFHGTYYNAPTVADQMSVWADRMANGQGLTGAWFDATDDWFWNNVGGVVVPGVDVLDAANRYLYQTKNSAERPFCGYTGYFLVGMHEG